jgi:hypothetical protein
VLMAAGVGVGVAVGVGVGNGVGVGSGVGVGLGIGVGVMIGVGDGNGVGEGVGVANGVGVGVGLWVLLAPIPPQPTAIKASVTTKQKGRLSRMALTNIPPGEVCEFLLTPKSGEFSDRSRESLPRVVRHSIFLSLLWTPAKKEGSGIKLHSGQQLHSF